MQGKQYTHNEKIPLSTSMRHLPTELKYSIVTKNIYKCSIVDIKRGCEYMQDADNKSENQPTDATTKFKDRLHVSKIFSVTENTECARLSSCRKKQLLVEKELSYYVILSRVVKLENNW